MTDYVIWLDSEKAQIFALKISGIEKTRIQKSGVDHHSRNKKDQHTDSDQEHFFRDLAVALMKVEGKLLILGPGLAKNHFKNYLESHHKGGLVNKIVGLENCDHPTDNQILAEARKFFKHYDLFNNPTKPSKMT